MQYAVCSMQYVAEELKEKMKLKKSQRDFFNLHATYYMLHATYYMLLYNLIHYPVFFSFFGIHKIIPIGVPFHFT